MPKPYFQLQQSGQSADIYLFGDIVDDAWYADETSPYSLVQAINGLGPDVTEINLHIDCYGGSVAGGWGIYNALRQRPGVTVRTYADGFVASAAIYPFLAGKERFANSVSAFYFHPVLTGAYGYADELRAEADAADKLTEIGRQALVDVAGLSQDAAQELLDSKTWYSPQQMLDMGIATAITGRSDAAGAQQSARAAVIRQLLTKPAAPDTPPAQPAQPSIIMQLLAKHVEKA